MTRAVIDTLIRQMDAAYRSDPFHALRKNLEGVRPEEWNLRPANWSTDVFGTDPELSICEVVLHVAGAKHMYANRAFGDASLEWGDLRAVVPGSEIEAVLAWLDDGHRKLAEGLAALEDDAELATERQAPWRTPMRRAQLIGIVINHDLYHSGEINRQRSLIRGADGWARDAVEPGGTPS